MDNKLYVYDYDELDSFKSEISPQEIESISEYLYQYETHAALRSTNLSEKRNTVIDITGLILDGNFYRTFVEIYIKILARKIPDVSFSIQYNAFLIFSEKYSFLFDKKNIDMSYHTVINEEENQDNSLFQSPITLYAYESATSIVENDRIISIGMLLNEYEAYGCRYNLETIASTIIENKINYIDISSFVQTMRLRQDMAIVFEVLVYKILRKVNVRFCIQEKLVSDISSICPLVFSKVEMIKELKGTEQKNENNVLNEEQIKQKTDEICCKLKGHEDFKLDFKQKYLQFCFLNQIGERAILSIFLAGNSGIGKTQFAKFLSEVLYPGEPLIKINFGNYSTDGVLNSLIGSPRGYIGSEDGGELINKIKCSKSHVILIDEFEKATPEVFNFFYELLEDGIFTDRQGVAHNLSGYIIVLTSNMNQAYYHKYIPNPLKSRFDMVYNFVALPTADKEQYINDTAQKLIYKINENFNVCVDIKNIKGKLMKLLDYTNLRDIKRQVESIVLEEFLKLHQSSRN